MNYDNFFSQLKIADSYKEIIEQFFSESMMAKQENSISFLEAENILYHIKRANLSEEMIKPLLNIANKIKSQEILEILAFHTYYRFWFCPDSRFDLYNWPKVFGVLGEIDTDLFYLLIAISGMEQIDEVYRTHNWPMEMALEAPTRIKENCDLYYKANNRWGIFLKTMYWWRLYKGYERGKIFRIGRFEYEIGKIGFMGIKIFIHRRTKKIMVISEDRYFNQDGECVDKTQAAFGGDGFIIDTVNGVATRQKFMVNDKWEEIIQPDDNILKLHIPAGPGMNIEKCRDSLNKAFAFFDKYFPQTQTKAVFSNSWMFHHYYKEEMPNSNVANFMRELYLFPVISSHNAGFHHIFGRDDDNYATYPRNTTLERVMLKQIAMGKTPRNGGMFFLKEDLSKFGKYRNYSV